MFFCTNCGEQLEDDAVFCTACGTPTKHTSPGSGETYSSDFFKPASLTPSKEKKLPGEDMSPKSHRKIIQEGVKHTPPEERRREYTPYKTGPACRQHPNKPAVAECVRCGSYVCEDCAQMYTVIDGEYAGRILCYDCCKTILSENVDILKKQKSSIIMTFVITGIGMLFGLGLFSTTDSGWAMLFGMLWIGSFWTWLKNAITYWWHAPGGRSIGGFIGSCIGAGLVAPIFTVKKLIECIVYLNKTSQAIKSGTEALNLMKDYMEFTQIINCYEGMDINAILGLDELRNNSYVWLLKNQGEAVADNTIRQGASSIVNNDKEIRSFSA